jgi:DnaJ domain
MRLPGRLRSSTLGDILGIAHRESASGAVELIESTGRTHRVHLSRGLIASVEIDRASPSLAEMLRREDAASEDVIRRSLLRALSSRRLHGEVLTEDFHVSPCVVDLALRRQIQSRLHALESVQDAQVLFRVVVKAPRGALSERPLTPAEFLHGRLRARDRATWSQSSSNNRPRTASGVSAGRSEALRILGLHGDASADAVKKVYRKLALTLHPDVHPRASTEERASLSARFQEVTTAYQALMALVALDARVA